MSQVFPFVEHYAGEAAMSNAVRTMHACPVASMDLKYARSMDVTTPAGFAIGTQWIVVAVLAFLLIHTRQLQLYFNPT